MLAVLVAALLAVVIMCGAAVSGRVARWVEDRREWAETRRRRSERVRQLAAPYGFAPTVDDPPFLYWRGTALDPHDELRQAAAAVVAFEAPRIERQSSKPRP